MFLKCIIVFSLHIVKYCPLFIRLSKSDVIDIDNEFPDFIFAISYSILQLDHQFDFPVESNTVATQNSSPKSRDQCVQSVLYFIIAVPYSTPVDTVLVSDRQSNMVLLAVST